MRATATIQSGEILGGSILFYDQRDGEVLRILLRNSAFDDDEQPRVDVRSISRGVSSRVMLETICVWCVVGEPLMSTAAV